MTRIPRARIPSEDKFLALPPDARGWLLARIGANLPRERAAAAVGISSVWLWMVETGRGTPSVEVAGRLRALYGIDQ